MAWAYDVSSSGGAVEGIRDEEAVVTWHDTLLVPGACPPLPSTSSVGPVVSLVADDRTPKLIPYDSDDRRGAMDRVMDEKSLCIVRSSFEGSEDRDLTIRLSAAPDMVDTAIAEREGWWAGCGAVEDEGMCCPFPVRELGQGEGDRDMMEVAFRLLFVIFVTWKEKERVESDKIVLKHSESHDEKSMIVTLSWGIFPLWCFERRWWHSKNAEWLNQSIEIEEQKCQDVIPFAGSSFFFGEYNIDLLFTGTHGLRRRRRRWWWWG